MQRDVYRKTEAGHAEIRSRALGLDARTRGLLILVNGQLTVGELTARVGFDAVEALTRFVGAGLVERVASAVVPKTKPTPAPPPPAGPVELLPTDLAAAQRRAFIELAPHYGPDAERLVEPLQQAATPAAFALTLAALREKLAVFMGRKLAEQLARRIAQGR